MLWDFVPLNREEMKKISDWDWPRKVKWFFQRVFRGYSDLDMIDFGDFVCRKTLPLLKKWVAMERQGYPAEFKSQEEWENVLKEIVWAVEETAYNNEENRIVNEWLSGKLATDVYHKMIDENWKRCNNGMKLFGEYLGAMWI